MSKKTNTNQTRPWTNNDKYLLMNLIGAYAGPVVQAFRRSWCIDSSFMVHAFR